MVPAIELGPRVDEARGDHEKYTLCLQRPRRRRRLLSSRMDDQDRTVAGTPLPRPRRPSALMPFCFAVSSTRSGGVGRF